MTQWWRHNAAKLRSLQLQSSCQKSQFYRFLTLVGQQWSVTVYKKCFAICFPISDKFLVDFSAICRLVLSVPSITLVRCMRRKRRDNLRIFIMNINTMSWKQLLHRITLFCWPFSGNCEQLGRTKKHVRFLRPTEDKWRITIAAHNVIHMTSHSFST